MSEVVLQATDVKKYFPIQQGIVFKRTIGQVKAARTAAWTAARIGLVMISP